MEDIPRLSFVKLQDDGTYYMYFWQNFDSELLYTEKFKELQTDPRLIWVNLGAAKYNMEWAQFVYYCWKTPDKDVVVEYTLKFG